MANNFKPILMTEEYWATSQFSVARYYGRIRIGGYEYLIVNKDGKDIFQCSVEAEKAGRDKAIEPGEPADLLRKDFLLLYRKLGRDKFIEILKDSPHASEDELRERLKTFIKKRKK